MESIPAKHILYISRWYPSSQDPMLGLFVKKHALAAVSAGFKVTAVFVVPALIAKSHELFSTEIKSENGLTEIIVNYRKTEGPASVARQLIALNLAVKTAVTLNGRPQLIHAHVLTRSAFLAWWYGFRWNVPFVITEHWSRYYPENLQYKGWLRKKITRFVINRAAATTVVSRRLADAMKKQGIKTNYSMLPNAVDTSLFNIAEKTDRKFRIVSVTCFEEKSKNLKLLIDAFALLPSLQNEAELVLIGEGADLEMIKRYAASKKITGGRIRFTGLLEGPELAAEIQQASCLALSSNYETFGIVAYESLACGVPVVATDVADFGEFITKNSGIIVPVGDVKAFAQALTNVLENKQLFNKAEMRSEVEQQYGFDAVSKNLADLYNTIINKKH
ncbi:MAG: glycosyltransferase family 4 protein [Lentimicrobium sp.]|nr:glycosyltransferase family 4 protein [Lentimicrobium sp.]